MVERFPRSLRRAVFLSHYVILAAFGALVAIYGWQVSELNSQSFSPALDLNLRWLYLSAVVGGVLIVIYSLITLGDVWRGGGPGLAGSD